MAEKRKIAAILAADVVGFSRMTSKDEDRTLARLRALRTELIDPSIASQNGRVFKRTGDGALVEFRSVVEAVRCAVSIQNAMLERNIGVPADQRIDFRIGIHLGDVVEESDGDLMGDGVNIAARLEGIAKPGAICLSEDAYRQVKGRLDLTIVDLGPTSLKNIAEPVRAYAVEVGVAAGAKPPPTKQLAVTVLGVLVAILLIAVAGGAWLLLGANRSFLPHCSEGARRATLDCCLALRKLTNDPAQDYFADGVTENLTTELSRIRGSFVIARNSAFTFKGKSVDAREIGKELGVRYVLEGSVQRDRDRVRVNAQLIDAESGTHVWADRFEEDLADLFKLQDQIVARLANELGVELVNVAASRVQSRSTRDVDADDLRLQGSAILNRGYTRENVEAAIKLFDQALAIDPNNTGALVALGEAIGWLIYFQWYQAPREQELARGLAAIDHALTLEPSNAIAHMAKGTLLTLSSRHDEAVTEFDTAISINPNLAVGYGFRGMAHFFMGRGEETYADEEVAMRLSPRDPILSGWYRIGCAAHVFAGQDEAAVEWCLKSAALEQNWVTYANLASAYGNMGREKEARAALAELTKLRADYTLEKVVSRNRMVSANPAFLRQLQTYVEGLRRAGLPEK